MSIVDMLKVQRITQREGCTSSQLYASTIVACESDLLARSAQSLRGDLAGAAFSPSLSIRATAVKGVTNENPQSPVRSWSALLNASTTLTSAERQRLSRGAVVGHLLQCCLLPSSTSSLCCTSVIWVFMLQMCQHLRRR
jgi:hypothetical protein